MPRAKQPPREHDWRYAYTKGGLKYERCQICKDVRVQEKQS